MREIKFLSPSSIAKFEQERETFYLRYLCPIKNPRPPQFDFMAVGSALDAYVKSAIHTAVYGEAKTKGSQFDFEKIFEDQVEAHVRDTALERATDLWNQYQASGSYGHLLADIVASPYAPEMEFTAKGEVKGVPLLGKPDLRYITKEGVHVIADWKVNGSTSKTGASPTQGYKVAYNDYSAKTSGEVHKKYKPIKYKDVEINETPLEEFCDYWADQLAVYAWLLGEPIGSQNFVVRMEQIACRPVKTRDLPRAKFATHMNRISESHQLGMWDRANYAWQTIQSGHIFDNLSREESDDKCAMLDGQAGTPKEMFPALAGCYNTSTRLPVLSKSKK